MLPQVKYWSWRGVTLAIIFPIYFMLISEGSRALIPALGQRLSRIPFIGFLDNFEATYRLHLGHLFATVLLVAVLILWEQIILILLRSKIDSHGFDPVMYRQLVLGLGITILTCDLILFYLAIARSTWGGSSFSFSAMVATVCYLGFLVFTAFFACVLKRDVDRANP